MILLDTHALVWLNRNNPRLGRRARAMAERAYQRGELAVSAISFWECAMLADERRLKLDLAVADWRRALIVGGYVELAVDGEIALRAHELPLPHRDPADRFIVATALHHGATLVTADVRLLRGVPGLRTVDAGA